MNPLKLIGLELKQIARQIWSLPQTFSEAAKQRRQRTVRHHLEVERLDRIRNPEKYRGK